MDYTTPKISPDKEKLLFTRKYDLWDRIIVKLESLVSIIELRFYTISLVFQDYYLQGYK